MIVDCNFSCFTMEDMFYNVYYATISEAFLHVFGKKKQSYMQKKGIVMTCRFIHSNVQILKSSPGSYLTLSPINYSLTESCGPTELFWGAAWSSLFPSQQKTSRGSLSTNLHLSPWTHRASVLFLGRSPSSS